VRGWDERRKAARNDEKGRHREGRRDNRPAAEAAAQKGRLVGEEATAPTPSSAAVADAVLTSWIVQTMVEAMRTRYL